MTEPLTDKEIAELRDLAKFAGSWSDEPWTIDSMPANELPGTVEDLIIAEHNAIPRLLEEVERLRVNLAASDEVLKTQLDMLKEILKHGVTASMRTLIEAIVRLEEDEGPSALAGDAPTKEEP